MKIIAFTGPGNAGKSTAAQGLGRQWHTATLSLTQPLYELAAATTGTIPQALVVAKAGGSPAARRALEHAGDQLRSQYGQDVLITRLVEQIRELEDSQDTPELVAIHDLRTEHEAQWVRTMGGLVVHVARSDGQTSPSRHHTNRPIVMHEQDAYLFNNTGAWAHEEFQQHARELIQRWITREVAA